MDPMKQQILQKLIANVIMAKCAQRENLIFQESWCSQERVIRFTTPFWQNLLGEGIVTYEAENKPNSFVVNCVCKPNKEDPKTVKVQAVLNTSDCVLRSWDLTNRDPNKIFDAFDELISKKIPLFEKEVNAKLQEGFVEGESEIILTSKYNCDSS